MQTLNAKCFNSIDPISNELQSNEPSDDVFKCTVPLKNKKDVDIFFSMSTFDWIFSLSLHCSCEDVNVN